MNARAEILRLSAIALIVCSLLSCCLVGCYTPPSQKRTTVQPLSAVSSSTATVNKTFSDIPTKYPSLYMHDPERGWQNIYDESKVIDWSEAGNYVGQMVTVEGDVDSVVHAASSTGSPYFFNIGGGAYEGFAVVIWSENLASFDDVVLQNDVAWSMSDQPLQIRMRASGVVEMYNGCPQITARDGTQVAEWVNDAWCSMMSDNAMEALREARYR